MNLLLRALAGAAVICLIFALAFRPGVAEGQAGEKIPIMLDCDIGTDIDETFAVALATISPELDLRGITTVSGDTRARALMVCRLLSAPWRGQVPVDIGPSGRHRKALRGCLGSYA